MWQRAYITPVPGSNVDRRILQLTGQQSSQIGELWVQLEVLSWEGGMWQRKSTSVDPWPSHTCLCAYLWPVHMHIFTREQVINTWEGSDKYLLIFSLFQVITFFLYVLPWVICLVTGLWELGKLGDGGVEGLAGALKWSLSFWDR